MNCPKPGGKVSVEMSSVTSAGNSRRLAGWHRRGWHRCSPSPATPEGTVTPNWWWGQGGTYFFIRKRLMVFWRRMNCTILRLR